MEFRLVISLFFKHRDIQESGAVDDSQHVDCFSYDAKHGSVVSIQQVTIMRSEYLVLWNEGASLWKALQGFDVFFEPPDESFRRFGTILGDKIPDFFDVSFRRACDSNAKPCGHV